MPGIAGVVLPPAWAAVATILAPLLGPHLRARARRGKEIASRLPERRGIEATARPLGPLVWLHAASVGETMSVLPVIARLAPATRVLVTTGTVASAELLAQRLPGMGIDSTVCHRFAPLDVPAWVARFLDHWRPDAAVFVESELWPNLLRACRARAVPAMLVNGRMSEASFRAWRRVPGFARGLLGTFDLVWARGAEDAGRFHALGVARAIDAGDLKFAAPPLPAAAAELDRLRDCLGTHPVWLAASTHPGEETAIAGVHHTLAARFPGLVTIIAPRHPDRAAVIAAEIGAERRSLGAMPAPGLWLADTLGEMGLWYRLARVVFVGRSLFPPGGGQNPLEPARLGCAIAAGPHTGNFAEHTALLEAGDAMRRVADSAALAQFVAAMLHDEPAAQAMGERASGLAARHADLPDRVAEAILALAAGRC